MNFISDSEIKGNNGINLAPMIDFLFLMLMFFACLAVSRIATKDTDIDLVEGKHSSDPSLTAMDNEKIINISINEDGEYKWITEIRDYVMASSEAIAQELSLQYEKGILPEDRLKTKVLLKIDKNAKWEPILKAIFAIRDAGFTVHPVYVPEELPDPK